MTPEYLTSAGGRGAVLASRTAASIVNRTSYLGFTLDASDSMSSLAKVAVESVNELISQQKKLEGSGDCRFLFTVFNNSVVSLCNLPLSRVDVSSILTDHYRPSGRTALSDAIANLISSLSAHAQGKGHSVLAVILTDGQENASQQHSKEDIRQMVSYRRVTDGWQFLFLGPERALSYALSIGIPKVNTAGFETTPEGLRLMLERLSRTMAAYRLGDRQFALKLKG